MLFDKRDIAVEIFDTHFKGIESIDEDVFARLKLADVPLIGVMQALRTKGILLAEAKQLLSASIHYAESYKKSEELTQGFFHALSELAKTDDSITLAENDVSIDLTKLRDEDCS